ncbi:MAG: acetolactate decarboxylase [Lachnospiraceae bacterium]|nr:acetolactate decarboxylase [Lachnospiraceae bacterium]
MNRRKQRISSVLLAAAIIISGSVSGFSAIPVKAEESNREKIYQVSLLQGLTLGDYHGSISAGTLKENGDIGIGTFDRLNGELIMLDGVVYRALGDGSVEEVKDTDTIPFADVTFFEADRTETLQGTESVEALKALLDEKVDSLGKNMFYMVRLDGHFTEMNVRSELAQEEPYKPLAKVLETDQTFFDYEDIDGTVVGLYCPEYMKDLNAAGWHFHFISDDHKKGGHVLGLLIDDAELSIDLTPGFSMLLPDNESFKGFDLTVDQSEDIKKVELNEETDTGEAGQAYDLPVSRDLTELLDIFQTFMTWIRNFSTASSN